MSREEKMEILEGCFQKAKDAGLVHKQGEFAEMLGISKTTLSSAMNGNERYLTDSLVDRARTAVDEARETQKISTILVIPTSARAGSLGDFSVSVRAEDCERIISPVRGADFAMMVTGDSMSPEYPNGSHILIKKIDETQFLEWGKVFVLDTANGAVIKQIFPTELEGVVECRSLNPLYPPFKVKTKDVFGWYRVLMVMSLK